MHAVLDSSVMESGSHLCVVASGFRQIEPGSVRVSWVQLDSATVLPDTWLQWHPDMLVVVRSCMPLEAFDTSHVRVDLRDINAAPGTPHALLQAIRLQVEQH
jgi:hypothetical protein